MSKDNLHTDYEAWLAKPNWWTYELVGLVSSPFYDALCDVTYRRDKDPNYRRPPLGSNPRSRQLSAALLLEQRLLEAIERQDPTLTILDKKDGHYLLKASEGLRFVAKHIDSINNQLEERAEAVEDFTHKGSSDDKQEHRKPFKPARMLLKIPRALETLLESGEGGLRENTIEQRDDKYYICFKGEESVIEVKRAEVLFREVLLRPNRYVSALELQHAILDLPLESSDPKALKDIGSRIRTLEEEKESAIRNDELDRAEKIEEELDTLKAELHRIANIHGDTRLVKDSSRRAMDSLRKKTERLVDTLRKNGSPLLASHLKESVSFKTSSLRYSPPGGTEGWLFIRCP